MISLAALFAAWAVWWWSAGTSESPRAGATGYVPARRYPSSLRRPVRRRTAGSGRARPPPAPVEEPSVAETIDLIRLALLGGLPTGAALALVADVTTPSPGATSSRTPQTRRPSFLGRGRTGQAGEDSAHLRAIAAAHAWGVDPDIAWARGGPQWAPARQALVLADRSGVPPADLLHHAAAEARRAQSGRVAVAAARLPVRLILPIGLLYLPAFMLTTVIPLVLALARDILGSW